MANFKKIPLLGSYKQKPLGQLATNLNKEELITVTIRLRRKNEITTAIAQGKQLSHTEFVQEYGADEKDLQEVESYCKEYKLNLIKNDPASRSLVYQGKITDFEQAFTVKLSHYNLNGLLYREREGEIFIPEQLKGLIIGIFGLDNRPAARPMFQEQKSDHLQKKKKTVPSPGFTGNQLASVYQFPAGFDGTGQTIGIIELGGGYKQTDIKTYFTQLGLKIPLVTDVLIDKGQNKPTNANSADGEVMLDIEIAGAVAPGSKIVVYFAPNTDQGFLDAITNAVHDTVNKPSVISISWGQAEINWTAQSLTNFDDAFQSAAVLGITVCVAAGDSGSRDGTTDGSVHVDFPASSPHVLACGGTSLTVNGSSINSEVVWHDSADSATGGGISEVFPVPLYQQQTSIPVSASTKFKGRGVPDVAACADPNTGYSVLVDGQQLIFGGTSAVAPLMAGLIALLNQQGKKQVGFINPVLYANPGICRDITSGDNITTTTNLGYTAGPGWDACTGWGVLNSLKIPGIIA